MDDLRKKKADLQAQMKAMNNGKSFSAMGLEESQKELARLDAQLRDLERTISDLEKLLASLQSEFDSIVITNKFSYEIFEEGEHKDKPMTIVSPLKLTGGDMVMRSKAQTTVNKDSRNAFGR